MIKSRPLISEDFTQIAEIYRFYVEHTASTFEEQAPSANELLKRYQDQSNLPFIVSYTDQVITGFAYV